MGTGAEMGMGMGMGPEMGMEMEMMHLKSVCHDALFLQGQVLESFLFLQVMDNLL